MYAVAYSNFYSLAQSREFVFMTAFLYLVQDGDTLASITQAQCGDASLAEALAAMNHIEYENLIYSGVNLIIDCDALKAWHPDAPTYTPGPNPDGSYG